MAAFGIACWFLGAATLHPCVALAEENLVLERGEKVTKDENMNVYLMRDKVTQRILYCITFRIAQPDPGDGLVYCGRVFDSAVSGEQPGSGFDSKDVEVRKRVAAGLDYIAYHGFFGDTTMRIGTITGDANKLYLTTQLAIYHVLEHKTGRSNKLEDSGVTDEIVDAANLLYKEADEYATMVLAHGNIYPERRAALWFHDSGQGKDRQNVITRAPKGKVQVQKTSANPEITKDNPSYSLKGAHFGIYSNQACSEASKVDEIVTDAGGFASTKKELPSGDYWIKEITPPKGFVPLAEPIKLHIAGGPQTATAENQPRILPIEALLAKVDAETKATSPRVGPSLEGALFTASYFPSNAGEGAVPARSWTLRSDQDGRVCLDEAHLADKDPQPLYRDASGKAGLPCGTLVVTETVPPRGYLLPKSPTWTFRIAQGTDGTLTLSEKADGSWTAVSEERAIEEPAVRGDIEFSKVEAGSGKPMPNVVFRVTSVSSGESHLIKTDGDGRFSSRTVAHTRATNALDAALTSNGMLDESKLSDEAGVWFYGYKAEGADLPSRPDDARGAFPWGTYRFEELSSTATQGHGLISFEATVENDGELVRQGTASDPVITLSTSARDAGDQDKYLDPCGEVTIEDVVRYGGLTPGEEYTLTCTLHRAGTGETLKDAAGRPYEGVATFTPQSDSGEQTVRVVTEKLPQDVDCIVAYERLTQDGQLQASHENPNDIDQTLYVPRLSTVLVDSGDGDHAIPADTVSTLNDTVTYHGLTPGQTYQLEGRLVDRASGKTLQAANGKDIVSTVELTPTQASGQAHVTFELDASGLTDHAIVAVETLKQDGHVICSHDDLQDADQTVSVVRQLASLPNTGSRTAGAMALAGIGLLAMAALGHRGSAHLSRKLF